MGRKGKFGADLIKLANSGQHDACLRWQKDSAGGWHLVILDREAFGKLVQQPNRTYWHRQFDRYGFQSTAEELRCSSAKDQYYHDDFTPDITPEAAEKLRKQHAEKLRKQHDLNGSKAQASDASSSAQKSNKRKFYLEAGSQPHFSSVSTSTDGLSSNTMLGSTDETSLSVKAVHIAKHSEAASSNLLAAAAHLQEMVAMMRAFNAQSQTQIAVLETRVASLEAARITEETNSSTSQTGFTAQLSAMSEVNHPTSKSQTVPDYARIWYPTTDDLSFDAPAGINDAASEGSLQDGSARAFNLESDQGLSMPEQDANSGDMDLDDTNELLGVLLESDLQEGFEALLGNM